MDKLEMRSEEITQENIKKIRELFPNAVTEAERDGKITLSIDFDVLKQELSDSIISEGQERYQMTWPGKKQSVLLANSSITDTLRPCKEESVDFDNTQNLYIEGDNLNVLKLLRETYLGKVKMIYIDPPYNTGNDFIYKDDFAKSSEEWKGESGDYDELGNRLVKNPDSNGRYHSDWLSMLYPRLRLARDLLSNDGVIIISISDAEFGNLKKICDELFDERNYCGDILWNSTKSVTNTALISVSHTYNLVYFKDIEYFIENRSEFRLPDEGEGFANPDNDPRGPWKADPFQVGGWRPNQQYEIINPKTGVIYKPNPGCSWKNDFKKFKELEADNRIIFGKTGEGGPQRKRFIWEAQDRGKVTKTWWDDVETTTNGTQLLKQIFNSVSIFDNPKPVGFIKRLLTLGSKKDSIILDFFSGSATTAHAVMQLNAEDGGNRKFIMVQLPEKCDEKSEAFKAGYKNICEIGKERIRRAGKKIKEENGLTAQNLDIGFRVLKLDSSNMQDVYYNPSAMRQSLLYTTIDNIKPDRTPLDLLFQVMLSLGMPLSSKIEEKQVNGKTYYAVNDNDIIACFDDDIDEEVITAIAKLQPIYAVFKDKSFATDSVGINNAQLFATYSPATDIKVI